VELVEWAPILRDRTDAELRLRPHRIEDVEAILEQCTDPLTQRWSKVPSPYLRMHAEEFVRTRPVEWAAGVRLSFAVEYRGRFAGSVALRPADPLGAAAEVGFGLAPWARGRGLATRAVRLLLQWGFDLLPLQLVRWDAIEGNWASRRVAWSLGFAITGPMPAALVQRGEPRSAWSGSLAAGEPMRPRTAWFDVPELTGRSASGSPVLLRDASDGDLERIMEGCADPQSQRWLPMLPSPYRIEHAIAYLRQCAEDAASGAGIHLSIDHESGLAGRVSLIVDRGQGEIGYWTHPQARGLGLTSAAVRALSEHALALPEDGGLGLRRLLIRAASENFGSQHVALAAGYRLSGLDRNGEQLRDGTVLDMYRFDRLPADASRTAGPAGPSSSA